MRAQGCKLGRSNHALIGFHLDVNSRFGANVSLRKAQIYNIGLITLLRLTDHDVFGFHISVYELLLVELLELVQNL